MAAAQQAQSRRSRSERHRRRTGRARTTTRWASAPAASSSSRRSASSGTYDSNVFATNDNEESDVGAILAPQVDVNSNWTRHALNFAAGAAGAAWGIQRERLSGRLRRTPPAGWTSRATTSLTGTLRVRPAARGPRRSGRERHDHDRHQRSRQSDALLSRPGRRPVPPQFRPLLHGRGRRRPAAGLRGHRRPRERAAATAGSMAAARGSATSCRRASAPSSRATTAGATTTRTRPSTASSRSGTTRASAPRSAPTVDITSILFGEMSFGYSERDYDSNELQ